RITASPGLTYTFDDDGNTIGRSDGATLSYTHENRLASFTQGSTTASYAYDPLGRRIKKTVNGVTTWYLWDGAELLAEYDGSGNRTKRYVYLPESYAPVQIEDANGTYNVHSDHLDTPKLLSDSTQQIVWRGRREAFGKTMVDPSSTVELNIRFPGQYYDQETGLHYNYFRYYDPAVGRYVTADPIGLSGGINIYAYVRGNPMRFIDANGLEISPFNPFRPVIKERLKGEIDRRIPPNAPPIPGTDRKGTIDTLVKDIMNSDAVDAQGLWDAQNDPDKARDLGDKIRDELKDKHPDWPWDEWDKFWPCLFEDCSDMEPRSDTGTGLCGA
ncbi:MAG: hypothetical protein J5I92_01580, partial [Thiogranum sp.]|nr:hypothetical protein [Thiogranum sp.]